MPLKSKIPQGRSKIPFLGISSKLPTRSKSSLSTKNLQSPVENRTLTNKLIDNNAHIASPLVIELPVDGNANESSFCQVSQIDIPINQELEENCEILSVSSVDPSPCKNCYDSGPVVNFDENLNLGSLPDNHIAPDLLAFQRFQEVLDRNKSPTFSEQSNQSETTSEVQTNSKLPLPPFHAINQKRSGLVKRSKITSGSPKTKLSPNSYSADKPGTKSDSNLSWKERNSLIKQKRGYSKPGFNQSKADSSRMSQVAPGRRRFIPTSNTQSVANGIGARKNAVTSRTNGGKWCSDIDSAMNLTRKTSKSQILEENGPDQSNPPILSQRSDRKKIYQERKNSIKNKGEFHQQNAIPKENDFQTYYNFESSKAPQDQRSSLNNPRSPTIARPVTRPPRRRHQQSNQLSQKPDQQNTESGENDVKPEQMSEDIFESDKFSGNVVSRRFSVPVSPEKLFSTTRSRQRRRASESHRIEISEISEESGYMSHNGQPACSDSASGDSIDLIRKQERFKQNERYRDILENPNVVTFGQWRIAQEGNYAPEQKYGITERRRIRSSTDSDSVSPVRKFQNSVEKSPSDILTPECDSDAVDRLTRSTSVESQNNTQVFEAKPTANDDGNDTLPSSDNDISMSAFDDLPSSNSTALIADYSLSSNQSQMNHGDEQAEFKQHTSLPNKVLNGLVEPCSQSKDIITKQRRLNEMGSPRSHSSPLRKKAAEDILRINNCVASGGDLAQSLDEMMVEYRIVRSALEQLYHCLDDEEQQKRKVDRENQFLKQRICDMEKEIERLSIINEKLTEEEDGQQKPITENGSSQTDNSGHKVLYKTELSEFGQDIKGALCELAELKNLKSTFEEKLQRAERRLNDILPVFNGV